MLTDLHVHTDYSGDGRSSAEEQLLSARKAGVTHICFTDHVDFDGSTLAPSDLAARNGEIAALRPRFPDIDISLGMEMGLRDAGASQNALAHAQGCEMDFIIGSVHLVDGVDAYRPEFFHGKAREEALAAYLEAMRRSIAVSRFSALGHYDFCAKYSPYPDRSIAYGMAPELFDGIFRLLIERGRAIEVNTSAWREGPAWGLDVLRRYRELGGEFVTLGSDAHAASAVGRRLGEALELARAAGIPYIATYKAMQPTFHRI